MANFESGVSSYVHVQAKVEIIELKDIGYSKVCEVSHLPDEPVIYNYGGDEETWRVLNQAFRPM